MQGVNLVRNLLASFGAEMKGLDNSFRGDTYNKTYTANAYDIQAVDENIKRKFNIQAPKKEIYQEPIFYQEPIIQQQIYQEPKMSVEDQAAKYLGRQPAVKQEVVQKDNSLEVTLNNALQPILEKLEVLAFLQGQTVQTLEKLIVMVSDEPQQPVFEEIEEKYPEVEVYQPDVTTTMVEEEL